MLLQIYQSSQSFSDQKIFRTGQARKVKEKVSFLEQIHTCTHVYAYLCLCVCSFSVKKSLKYLLSQSAILEC